jgi:2-polyprenyl-6-methoxyphenol hydroxylase-like FAD-dependent oxidoreductase
MRRALIAGGSLGGLFAGLLLRQAGWDVTVFERSARDLASRGVGLGTHPEQMDIMRRVGVEMDPSIGVRINERICLGRDGAVIAALPFSKVMSSWARLYGALRRQMPDNMYCAGMQLDAVENRPDGVTAIFADGSRIDGDVMIGADGLRSTVRACCFPGVEPSYAGYIAWRGVVSEHEAPKLVRDTIFDKFAFFLPQREMVLSYPVPARDDASTARDLNWMWYHPLGAAKLPDMCTDATGRCHGTSIPPPLIRPDVVAAFLQDARDILPPPYVATMEATADPFFQAIFDLDSPGFVAGRAVLLGDAASVARPHVAAGVSKAALNAAWLADALSGPDIDAGLAAYNGRAQPFGATMVARARWIGAYLEDPPRTGIEVEPLRLMKAIGAPLHEIEGLFAAKEPA